MPNLHPNSTDYVHSYEPNTNDLTMAMDYNSQGQPVIRTAISGGITIDEVNVTDVEISNDDGNPIPISANKINNSSSNPIWVKCYHKL